MNPEAHNKRLHSTAAAGHSSESQSKRAAAASEPQTLAVIMKTIVTLHRYFIWANCMRTNFDKCLKDPRFADSKTDQSWFFKEPGTFMSYWYAGLYVVIEGFIRLGLHDPEIDELLKSPNVSLLKRYRNGVCHFQKHYFDSRFISFFEHSFATVPWVWQLNRAFGRFFLEQFKEA